MSTTATAAAAPVKKTATKKKAAETPVEVAAPAPAPTPIPVPAEPVKKTASRKVKAAEPAAVPPPAETAATTTATETDAAHTAAADGATPTTPVKRKILVSRDDVLKNNTDTDTSFKSLLQTVKDKKIAGITKTIESLKKQVTKAGLDSVRAIDQAKKSSRRKAPSTVAGADQANKKPSGLNKPILLSPEFAQVIKVDPTVPMTRGEAISKLYYDYICANGLKTPGKGRHLNPDATLMSLLRGWSGGDLNFITIRAYLGHHFSALPETAAAPAVVEVSA